MSRTWLITGASSGFGRLLSERVASSGDDVIAVARREDRLNELAAKHPEHISPVALDLTSSQAASTIYAVIRDAGGLDVLVNFFAALTVTRTALSALRLSQGRIVQVLSFFSELAPAVHVTTIHPGASERSSWTPLMSWRPTRPTQAPWAPPSLGRPRCHQRHGVTPTWWWTPCSPSSMPPNRLDGWPSGLLIAWLRLGRIPLGWLSIGPEILPANGPGSQPNAEPSVVVMTTNNALDKKRLPEHTQRLDWMTIAPDVLKAMIRLDTATGQGVEAELLHLVKIRSSQINCCAYCIDMHTKVALAEGESVERIVQLGAWRESKHFYTAKEIAAIELTEAVTVLTDGFVPDDVYARAAGEFTETELVYLIGAITMINAWNRFGVSTRMVPGHYTPAT